MIKISRGCDYKMSLQDEVIKTVETVVQRYFNRINSNSDVVSVITAVNGDKYKLNINGTDYWLKDGIGLNLTVGTQVWVRIVGKEMYIASRR